MSPAGLWYNHADLRQVWNGPDPDMIKVNYVRCVYCLEKQATGGVSPGTIFRCMKCGESFTVGDPRFTGKRGILKRAIGIAGLLAGAAAIAASLYFTASRFGPGMPEFKLESAGTSPPAVALPSISNRVLGYEFSVPPGWEPLKMTREGGFQITLVNGDSGGELSLSVETVDPPSDFDSIRKKCLASGGDMRLLLALISGRRIEVDSYEYSRKEGFEEVEFEFKELSSNRTGDSRISRGFLLPRGGRWFWFYLSSGPAGMQVAYSQTRNIIRTLKVER